MPSAAPAAHPRLPPPAAARPELPEVLQPADWPGQQARLLCKELYKRLEAPSNRHLDQEMCLADGSVPVVDRSLPERFRNTTRSRRPDQAPRFFSSVSGITSGISMRLRSG